MTTSDQPTGSPHVMVVGTASLDVLHLGTRTAHTIGGAGLYTALAAHHAGATTALYAPRPDPMPASLQPVADRVIWTGPLIAPDALPRLEIAQHGGGRATLIDASWGAESQLTHTHLSEDIRQATFVHIAALRSAQRQLDFMYTIMAERGGHHHPRISVGTYARLVYGETKDVRTLFEHADIFF